MAKRPDLSAAQRKIVDRYYEHQGSIHATKLAELASEIALASATPDAEKKLATLWKRAGEYLVKCKVEPAMAAKIAATRDVALLARAAGEVATRR
jgi:hypothetical protein